MANKIAVVVLNYNHYEDTILCTDSMLKKNVAVDIIIVDNNSSNDSFNILYEKYKSIEWVYVISNESNTGYAAGNNIGLRFALENNPEVEYVCIMNPDTLFEDAMLLDTLSKKLESHEDAAVIAPVMIQHGDWDIKHTYWDIPGKWDFLRRQFVLCRKRNQTPLKLNEDKTAYVGVVHGSFLMLKAQALKEIGFLDESTFLYCEENMLALDMRNIGRREMLAVTDVFYHNHKESIQHISLKHKLQVARISSNSRKCICKKHYNNVLLPIMDLLYIINIIVITAKHLGGLIKKR